MPITADNNYFIESAGTVKFQSSPTKIYCPFDVNKDDEILVHVHVYDTSGVTLYGTYSYLATEADIEAHEGAGTGEYTQMKSCVEKDVKSYLESLSGNTGVAFTIV